MSRAIVHEIVGHFCATCGESVEWLLHRGHEVRGFDRCEGFLLSGNSTALSCVRESGHPGDCRSFGGSEWANRGSSTV